jgi:hypothetical protein
MKTALGIFTTSQNRYAIDMTDKDESKQKKLQIVAPPQFVTKEMYLKDRENAYLFIIFAKP